MAKLAASLICADPLNIKTDIQSLINGSIDQIHFDVMDGTFVPRFGLYPEILQEFKKNYITPVDVHLMIENPEDYLDLFKTYGADTITFHWETTKHASRIIHKIKKLNIKAGIALNPSTPASAISEILEDVDMVCLMAIDPGIVGGKFYDGIYNKISEISNNKHNIEIQIDGGVTPTTIIKMIEAGANNLVCGTGTIFRKFEDTIENKIKDLRRICL